MPDPIYGILHANIHQCELCRTDRYTLEAAHLIKRSQGGPATRTNLAMLCQRCHRMFDQEMTRAGRKTMCGLLIEKIEARPLWLTDELEAA